MPNIDLGQVKNLKASPEVVNKDGQTKIITTVKFEVEISTPKIMDIFDCLTRGIPVQCELIPMQAEMFGQGVGEYGKS